MMLESAGFEITDLGVDVTPEQFVQAVQAKQAQIVGLSALLTTTMPMMRATIDALLESGLRDQVKVIIGGAPVTQKFADEIGADGFAPDAGSASKLAKQLLA
jgi:5-methyltetrahydrofolate--homocysteine methyltransferase